MRYLVTCRPAVESPDQVRRNEAVVDRNHVGDAVSAVDDDSCKKTLRVEHEHRLYTHMRAVEAILFKHCLNCLLAIILGFRGASVSSLMIAGVDRSCQKTSSSECSISSQSRTIPFSTG